MAGRNVVADVIDGAIAGALATWVMGKVTTYLYDHEDEAAREREDEARGGTTAYGVAAEKTAALVGRELSDEERKKAASAIHWGLGIGAGAIYGVLRGRVPNADLAKGLAYGTAFFGLMDETLTPVLGLTPGPLEFPWQTHGRGLAGHLVFGAVADASLAVLNGRAD